MEESVRYLPLDVWPPVLLEASDMLGLVFLLVELELLGLEVPVLVVVLEVVGSDRILIFWVFLVLLLVRWGFTIATLQKVVLWARS